MNDDLLPRLRARMFVTTDLQNLLDEAADEIVRLRAAPEGES
jgi:hypothetical protein